MQGRRRGLQVKQLVAESRVRRTANVLAGHVRQFVRVLARGRDSHRSRPIVVHVGHLVRETLHVIGWQRQVVVHADKMRRSDSALTHVLRDEEEVVVVAFRDRVIHDRTRRRIIETFRRLHEQLRVDALLDDHDGKLRSETDDLQKSFYLI